MTGQGRSKSDSGVDHVQRFFGFCGQLKGAPLTRFEMKTANEILRLAVLDTVKEMKRQVEANPEAHR